jgi:hypothetical protein
MTRAPICWCTVAMDFRDPQAILNPKLTRKPIHEIKIRFMGQQKLSWQGETRWAKKPMQAGERPQCLLGFSTATLSAVAATLRSSSANTSVNTGSPRVFPRIWTSTAAASCTAS